jgi:hypothetical protein
MVKKGTLTRRILAYGWPIKNQQDCLYKQMTGTTQVHKQKTETKQKHTSQM